MYTRVCALIIEDDEVLLIPHQYKEILWHLPGGKAEDQDITLEQALKREIKEELKLDIVVDDLAFVCEGQNNSRKLLQLVFFAHRNDKKQISVDQGKTSGIDARFVPINELSDKVLYPNIGNEIMLIQNKNRKGKVYLGLRFPSKWL